MEQTSPLQDQQQDEEEEEEPRSVDQQRQQQPIMQYQQMQPPFQPQVQMVRAVHVSARGVWTSKLTLRIASVIADVILIGITAYVASGFDIFPIISYGPPACVAIIWNIAESICLCVRQGYRGIHPGAIVGLDLLIWLGYLVDTIFLALFGVAGWGYYLPDDIGESLHLSLYRTIFAFGIIEILIHITLFVIGCYETSLRSRSSQIYVQSSPNGIILYPPPNVQMAQVYQQPYGYYMPPQGQVKSDMPSTVFPVSLVHNQHSRPSGQQSPSHDVMLQ